MELFLQEKNRLLEVYENNCGSITKEAILEMLFDFEKKNDLNLKEEDFESLRLELIKLDCRNCSLLYLSKNNGK
jgi:hypothetical protein